MIPIPEKLLASIEQISLPVLPQVLLRLLNTLAAEGATYEHIAVIVSQDAALSLRMLAAANAVETPPEGQAGSLPERLGRLGLGLIKAIATGLSSRQVFDRMSDEARCDLQGYWAHSLLVAETARLIAQESAYANLDQAYLAGLLHDVGELALVTGVPEYAALLSLNQDEVALSEYEMRLLGATHATVGAWLIDRARLNAEVVDAVLFHHHGAREMGEAAPLCRIVWAANMLALGGQGGDVQALRHIVNIAPENLIALRDKALVNVSAAASDLLISLDPAAATVPVPGICLKPTSHEGHTQTDQAELALQQMVRDTALMQPIQQTLIELDQEDQILHALRETAITLMGSSRIALFLHEADRQVLSGRAVAGQASRLREMEIPLIAAFSLVATAAVSRALVTSHGPLARPLTMLDHHITRALETEGLICVPLIARDRLLGVLVLGANAAQQARIKHHPQWMNSFARLAANVLDVRQFSDLRESQMESELGERYRLKARQVAHEAGNPLGIIKNYVKILSLKVAGDSPVQRELGILNEEIDRVSEIVRGIPDIYGEHVSITEVDVNGLLRELIGFYGETLFTSRGITVEVSLDPNLPLLRSDRNAIKQSLLNLWKNASNALGRGGKVLIATVVQDDDLEIRVSDNGPGVPPEVMKHLFTPQAATVRRPRQEGLGLSIVYAIMQRLGGRIECSSEPGRGARFSLLLPRQGKTNGGS